jgi:hypothetical protein
VKNNVEIQILAVNTVENGDLHIVKGVRNRI